jgi:hypothetical protein
MKSTLINFLSIAVLGGVILLSGACKKKEDPTPAAPVVISGCTDIDSPYYDSEAEESDGSCTYAKVSQFEITYHPENDNGSVWDYGIGSSTNADLLLRVKVQGSPNWLFESTVASNQEHNVPAQWASPSPLKLLNTTYEWELYDEESTNADDFISSGTFNPIALADLNNKTITTVSGGSQLKIYFNIQ